MAKWGKDGIIILFLISLGAIILALKAAGRFEEKREEIEKKEKGRENQ